MLSYTSIYELCKEADKQNKKISEIVLNDEALQMEQTEQALFDKMGENFKIFCTWWNKRR